MGGGRRHSTVPSTDGEAVFTGRARELRAIEEALDKERIVVLHGAPGRGKSRIAKEYAHAHAAAYPGGAFFVRFEQTPPIELAKLLRDLEKPVYSDESIEDQCRRALRAIGAGADGRALIVYDAVAEEAVLHQWRPYDGDWHLLVTSTSTAWPTSVTAVEVDDLPDEDAGALVEAILGDPVASERLVPPIVAKAGGVTIELCASATAARRQLQLRRTVAAISAEIGRETGSSFGAAWKLLSQSAQLVLRTACAFPTTRVPASLLRAAFPGWEASALDDAIDEVYGRNLAERVDEVIEVHQLVAGFVREQSQLPKEIRVLLFEQVVSAAEQFAANPGDLSVRALLLAQFLDVDTWADLATTWEWHMALGSACVELGRFGEAFPWFERAVAAAGKADEHGRMDARLLGTSMHRAGVCQSKLGNFDEALRWYEGAVAQAEKSDVRKHVGSENLGRSLHQVGWCYSNLGKFAEALQWYERAVDAKRQGDEHGRVDEGSLGRSLHQVGDCYSRLGTFAEALRWYEEAVAAAKKGDVYGRVDATSLSASLHQVGACYGDLGKFAEALSWYEQAVAAARKGDLHGRVDTASLGSSLHQVGVCYSDLGKNAEALSWYEQAVIATEKGDVHGRVDAESVGRSLHQVGFCHGSLGNFIDAIPWYERAVVAKEKGDEHGRMDAASLSKSLFRLGGCYRELGKFAEALPWFERAVVAAERGDIHGRVNAQELTNLREALEIVRRSSTSKPRSAD